MALISALVAAGYAIIRDGRIHEENCVKVDARQYIKQVENKTNDEHV